MLCLWNRFGRNIFHLKNWNSHFEIIEIDQEFFHSISKAIHDFQLNFIITFMGVFISGGTLYLYCESAQLATDNLIQFGDEVFDSDWYKLPIEIQKSFILIIANAELPINYDGLHMVDLNSPTFARVWKNHCLVKSFELFSLQRRSALMWHFLHFQVLKSVMSYYLMFKTLAG